MDEDFVMKDDQQKSQGQQDTDVTCGGSAGGRHKGQLDSGSATLTGLGPLPFDVYIPQPTSPPPPSTTIMARPLARTRTLGQMGRTESYADLLSTPLSTSGESPPMPLLQHRESSAALPNDDDEEDVPQRLPGIRIENDTDDDWETGTQTSESQSQDVPMSTPQVQSSPQPSTNTTAPIRSFGAARDSLVVNTASTANARRFPSPIPTEPEDPYPEFISNLLAKQNIKVRDFGMCPPYATSPPTPATPATTRFSQRAMTSITSPPVSSNADDSTSQNLSVPLTPETFNPREALGEFEFRLRQHPRTLPIPGKTLRRLIEIGWVSENEVESRCSQEDLNSLDEFDSRNRTRLLRFTALREQRTKDLGISSERDPGPEEIWGFTPTGAYPYLTLKYDSIPSPTERNELVKCVRQMFVHNDRFIRMAMATERAREKDRLEAEEVLMKRQRDDEEKERIERETVEREMLQGQDEEMRDASGDNLNAGSTQVVPELQPPAEIMAAPTTSRKRSPHQAWAEDDDNAADNDIDDLDAKRLRLARSQSETWYEHERRRQQESQTQTPGSQLPIPQAVPQPQQHSSPSRVYSRPHSRPQTPRKVAIPSQSQTHTQNSQSQSQHTHSRSQSQSTSFVPPEIQYPAPLSTYDPELYPDAASVIESQSQSQGRPNYQVTPPASPVEDEQGDGGVSGRNSSIARGTGLGEDGEEDTRPNALKRSPKKGLKRTLTRGRTLVEIC